MKSPICYLCNKDFSSAYFHASLGGALVQFADYRPLREGAAGHPQGLEWFCEQHLQEAQALAEHATAKALLQLTEQYGVFPPYEPKPIRDPELWVTAVGPNPAKVFALLRQATPISPADAKKLLAAGEFKVSQGWPVQFQYWKTALAEAGARLEVRFP